MQKTNQIIKDAYIHICIKEHQCSIVSAALVSIPVRPMVNKTGQKCIMYKLMENDWDLHLTGC